MKATVKWVDEVTFLAESGSGHTIVMDGPPDHGGRNLAARPMEMLLMGLGGCAAFDVVSILRKSRQTITDCRVGAQALAAGGWRFPVPIKRGMRLLSRVMTTLSYRV